MPHSGTLIPAEYESDFILQEDDLEQEILYMADNYTDELYKELLNISSYVQSTVSRILVDIERFEDEEDEPMSKVGMSAFYTMTSEGELLRTITDERRIELEKIYKNYHDTFTDLVTVALSNYDTAIIVDCHSFASIPRIYESDKDGDRPDICIGVDEYHTPKELVERLQTNFGELGYSVKVNSPFAGSIVPALYYQKDIRVISVMIEVNRKLYIDELTFQKSKNFSEVSRAISRAVIKSLNEFIK